MTKVLYLAANPTDTPSMRLDIECREIADIIRTGRYRERITFTARWAARPDDLLQALNEEEPQVLHFSGHGGGVTGLSFEGPDGISQAVSADALAQVLGAAGDSVRLVVLNACYSEVQAEALRAHVPCVVGIAAAIGDRDAARYAVAFYRALAFGHTVGNAHQQGLAALALHASPDQSAVRLVSGHGVNPELIRLVEPPSRRPRSLAIAVAVSVALGAAALAYHFGTEARSSKPTRPSLQDDHPITPPTPQGSVIQQAGSGSINVNGSGNTAIINSD
jgi:hypothetical protein